MDKIEGTTKIIKSENSKVKERKRKSLLDKRAENQAENLIHKAESIKLVQNLPMGDSAIQNSTPETSDNKKMRSLKNKVMSLTGKALNNQKFIAHKQKATEKFKNARRISPLFDRSVKIIDRSINFMMHSKSSNRSEVIEYTRGPAVFGIWVTIIFFGSFLIWGVWAPLNSAAHVDGQLVLESKKRLLQHQTGGIIERIYVKNGDEVEKGELLISLDKSLAKAKYEELNSRVMTYQAEHARLSAERDGNSIVKYDDKIIESVGNEEISKIVKTQDKLFAARKSAFEGRIRVREEKIKQYRHKKEASQAQLNSYEKQILIVQDQINSYERLAKSGNVSKENLRRYEQSMAELQGRKSSIISELSIIDETILEEEIGIENDRASFLAEIQKELRQNQEHLSHLLAEFKSIEQELARLDIIAPVSGIVSNLTQHTEGGVLSREHPIMEIVPQDDKLVFDARVRVEDIDVVRVGQKANVKLTPFKSRVVPSIEGRVISVSADIVPAQHKDDRPHYNARIEFNKESLKAVTSIPGVELYPGMPGQGLIEIGNRTLLKYLLDPITTSFDKAFIEQ